MLPAGSPPPDTHVANGCLGLVMLVGGLFIAVMSWVLFAGAGWVRIAMTMSGVFLIWLAIAALRTDPDG
jgi:hypothetical protein